MVGAIVLFLPAGNITADLLLNNDFFLQPPPLAIANESGKGLLIIN